MSFSSNNTNTYKSRRGQEDKSYDGSRFRKPSNMTIGAAAGYVMPRRTYPTTDTFEFLVHKHGQGTRTHDIATTYAHIISEKVPDIKVTSDGPKITMSGNREDLKKVMIALIEAFKVRKHCFEDTGKHKDAIIAAKDELIYFLERDFKKEVDYEDISYEPPDKVDNKVSFVKNTFSGLEIYDDNDSSETRDTMVAEPVVVAAPVVSAEPVKLSKKQRKEQSRMNYEELKFGPALVLGRY